MVRSSSLAITPSTPARTPPGGPSSIEYLPSAPSCIEDDDRSLIQQALTTLVASGRFGCSLTTLVASGLFWLFFACSCIQSLRESASFKLQPRFVVIFRRN